MDNMLRIDAIENNNRLYIDTRDIVSIFQYCISDANLDLDDKTMLFATSIFNSLITTYEVTSDDIIKLSVTTLYKLKKEIDDKYIKLNKPTKKSLFKKHKVEVEVVEVASEENIIEEEQEEEEGEEK